MPAFAPRVRERLSGLVPASVLAATQDLTWFYVALVFATVVPAAVVLAATSGRASGGKAWAVVFVQSLFLVNVFVPHVPAAVALGGYAPGVVTAVLVNLPYSVYFLRRSVSEGVVSRSGAVQAVALAIPCLLVAVGALYVVASGLV